MKRWAEISTHAARAFQVSLGVLILVMMLWPAFSWGQGLSENEQVPIFLKILTYDRTFKNVPASSLHLGILFRPDRPASVAGAQEMNAALASMGEDSRHDQVWSHESIPWTSPEELARKLSDSHIDILYVTPGQETLVREISRWTREFGILTLGPGHQEVDLGLSLGLALTAGRPRIAVNLTALQEEGHDLDSRILRLCKVVRE